VSATLVVETGSGLTTSNAYATVAQADAYHERRLHSQVWEQATDDEKTRALIQATQELDDAVIWLGVPVNSSQALCWPRASVRNRNDTDDVSSSTIPQWLKDATAELARLRIEKPTPTEPTQVNVSSSSTRAGSKSYHSRVYHKLPLTVLNMVRHYIRRQSFQVIRS